MFSFRMMTLKDIIIERIRKDGPITFHDYMDMCLYYPELGYYSSMGSKIGKEGDFYTSSSLTSSFGAIIARQMEEMWRYLGKTTFTIIEYGAGLGSLCQDIMEELSKNRELYEGLRYCIIEKSAFMVEHEQKYLKDNLKVRWFNQIEDIPDEIDCIFSNELFDNFPVHQVVMEDQLMEIFVDYKEGFIEVLQPANQDLKDYFKALDVNLSEGYRTEVNLEAVKWTREIAACLKKGFVMTIDYGDLSEQLYKSYRNDGTIICYNKHKISQDPYCNIGQQDITAHINFSALEIWGKINGLFTCGITSQAYFLIALGFREHFREEHRKMDKSIIQLAQEESFIFYTLLFDMGYKYNVLIQSKGLPETQLTGLQYVKA